MAGIKEAMKRVAEHRNEGKVVAMGALKECSCGTVNDHKDLLDGCSDCGKTRYLIISLYGDCIKGKRAEDVGLITVYDHGSDIKISDDINIQDDVILMIQDNWSAIWMKKESGNQSFRLSLKVMIFASIYLANGILPYITRL